MQAQPACSQRQRWHADANFDPHQRRAYLLFPAVGFTGGQLEIKHALAANPAGAPVIAARAVLISLEPSLVLLDRALRLFTKQFLMRCRSNGTGVPRNRNIAQWEVGRILINTSTWMIKCCSSGTTTAAAPKCFTVSAIDLQEFRKSFTFRCMCSSGGTTPVLQYCASH